MVRCVPERTDAAPRGAADSATVTRIAISSGAFQCNGDGVQSPPARRGGASGQSCGDQRRDSTNGGLGRFDFQHVDRNTAVTHRSRHPAIDCPSSFAVRRHTIALP